VEQRPCHSPVPTLAKAYPAFDFGIAISLDRSKIGGGGKQGGILEVRLDPFWVNLNSFCHSHPQPLFASHWSGPGWRR
jgi:hypothetical protein